MRDYNFRIIMEMKWKGEYVQFWGEAGYPASPAPAPEAAQTS